MPAVTRKMADLKNEILAKIDEKCREFKSDFMNEIKDFRAVRVVFWSPSSFYFEHLWTADSHSMEVYSEHCQTSKWSFLRN